ncbi:efflux RND transporter periplasmic adaptor subunit [Aureimonas sp. OT7]|uniref:efflux RND transporter periplasmic adaptor subunit n=1 Tax=Aureimonas sp. OT7 TaxID=2816454 RepID=UPI001FEEBBA2|nr:efflux RND transporter periplasmic adaptor subunit [Aureimonas sp. OT7]
MVSPGQTVLTLARPDVREAVIDVPDQAASSLAVGMPFNVRLELDHGMTTTGRVREIAPSADPATRSRRVRITLDAPPEDFRLGSTVRVFPADEGPPGIALPASAVRRTADGDFVFVIEDGTRAVRRAVDVEPFGPGFRVTSGLSGGETVATAGVNRLEDGQAVRIGGEAI